MSPNNNTDVYIVCYGKMSWTGIDDFHRLRARIEFKHRMRKTVWLRSTKEMRNHSIGHVNIPINNSLLLFMRSRSQFKYRKLPLQLQHSARNSSILQPVLAKNNLLCLLTYLFTCLTHGAESFLSSQPVLSHSRNSSHFMEHEGSLPHSQVRAICPYPEPVRSCLNNS